MTREQNRAAMAFKDVSNVPEEMKKRFATVVYQFIILVRTAGILQALEFIEGLSNKDKQEAGHKLLDYLGKQMKRVNKNIKDKDTLRKFARTADLHKYMLLTREVMSTMIWYRRFVQSVLKIDIASAMQNDDN